MDIKYNKTLIDHKKNKEIKKSIYSKNPHKT